MSDPLKPNENDTDLPPSSEANRRGPFDKTPSFKLTPIESLITEHALLLVGANDQEVRPVGTAVVVSAELLLTAAHVVTYLWETLEQKPVPGPEPFNQQSTFAAVAIHWPGQQSEAAVWSIESVWLCPGTDIAFVKIKPGNGQSREYTWSRWLAMDLDIPPMGSRVTAFGYPGVNVLHHTDEEMTVFLRPSTAVGEITDVFPEGRDRVMLNFPCYQVNARFDSGMSGGPVISDSGRLCGIVCSSMRCGEEHISYVAALWPSMFATLNCGLPGLPWVNPYQAWELASIGALHAPEWESIHKRAYIGEDENAVPVLKLKPKNP